MTQRILTSTLCTLLLITALGVGSSGCASVAGRMGALQTRDYTAYPGLHYAPEFLINFVAHAYTAKIDCSVCLIWLALSLDTPLSLALDTALLPIDLVTLWLMDDEPEWDDEEKKEPDTSAVRRKDAGESVFGRF